VTGRAIAKVTFYVDGRAVATVRARPGRKALSTTINPRGQSRRVHRVTARVTFTRESRTPTARPRLAYRRPPLASGPPRFTG